MRTFIYPATITVDTAGLSLVTCPAASEAGTDAETRAEALCAAPDALIASYEVGRLVLYQGGQAQAHAELSTALALYRAIDITF